MDGLTKLWDVDAILKRGPTVTTTAPTKGHERASFKGHQAFVTAVAFTRDDKIVASGSHDNTARLWEVATGKELATLKGHTGAIVTRHLTGRQDPGHRRLRPHGQVVADPHGSRDRHPQGAHQCHPRARVRAGR